MEKKEADEKIKRKIDEVKKKALKKEKKDSQKDESKSKDVEEGGEDVEDELIPKSKKSDAGAGKVVEKNKVTLPITCTSAYLDLYDVVDDDAIHGKRYIDCRKVRCADASPCSDVSTDVPDDEEYLTEWDEWSEIEKGYGPKASWNGDVWNTSQV